MICQFCNREKINSGVCIYCDDKINPEPPKKLCCGEPMVFFSGCGWNYDYYYCYTCNKEVYLETTSYLQPEEVN